MLYFTAEREPVLRAAAIPTALFALAAVFFRRQIVPQVIALGLFGIALEFAVATLKTSLINHPVLRFAADADGRDAHDQSLGQGIACDPSGCIGKLADGGLVSYALSPEAYEEGLRARRACCCNPRRAAGGLQSEGHRACAVAGPLRGDAAPPRR